MPGLDIRRVAQGTAAVACPPRRAAMARQDGVPSGIRHMVTNYRFRQSVWYPNNNARLSEVYCFFEIGEVIALENDCQLIN
jgi:hypothetical protein